MKSKILLVLFICFISCLGNTCSAKEPLKVGIIGLTHTHVHWIFGSEPRGDIKIVGIVEPNTELAKRYAAQYHFSMNLVYASMDEMFANVMPEAVTAFGTIYEHLEVVEAAAPRGIHVMVEKPLAVSTEHAMKMKALAQKHQIHLLTNYETTWYPSVHQAYDLVKNQNVIGSIRKVMVHDGHRGPKKIGVNDEFLNWLTDPIQNGGGADVDFGCYGVNILTWLLEGERPNSVTAVALQLQAENNPKVNDESIIVLQYDSLVAIIQGSWNWPIGRKDMEVYGLTGALYADNKYDLRIRSAEGYDGFEEKQMKLKDNAAPYDDPFAFLAAVVREEVRLDSFDLSGLENNLLVVEILDAARLSASCNKTINLED